MAREDRDGLRRRHPGRSERQAQITGGTDMLLDGCHEGKHTPRLTEVKCPQCGEWVDVFVLMGGRPGQTGTLASDEKCECGYVLKAGSYEGDYER